MRVEIIRTPGTDLAQFLAVRPDKQGGPVEVPEGLEEGDMVDLADDVAEVLIEAHVAAKPGGDKPAGKATKPAAGKMAPDKPAPKADHAAHAAATGAHGTPPAKS